MPLLRCGVAPGRLGMPMGMPAARSFLGVPKADVRAGLGFFVGSALSDNDIEDLELRNRFYHVGYVAVPERGELHPEVDVQAELNGSYNPRSMVRRIDKALEHCKHDMDLSKRAPLWGTPRWAPTTGGPIGLPKGCHRIGGFEFSEKRRHHPDERCTFCRTRRPRRFDYPADLRDAAVPLVAAAKRLCTHLLEHVWE